MGIKYAGPGKIIMKPGADYGPLWLDEPIAVVLHTTETEGLPSYSSDSDPDMEYNPKITIDPKREIVYVHTDLDRRDGALRGTKRVFDDTGVWCIMNEKAINIEIIAYSDASVADQRPDRRLAVRDFTDQHYEFIAQVVAHVMKVMDIPYVVTQPPLLPYPGWRYGLNSPVRGSCEEWRAFEGVTAHGWVFGQSHWDTNGMDLERIVNRAKEINMPEPTTRFSDVPRHYIFFDEIEEIAELGITRGAGTDENGYPVYLPDEPVTRGQMAAFISRLIAAIRRGDI